MNKNFIPLFYVFTSLVVFSCGPKITNKTDNDVAQTPKTSKGDSCPNPINLSEIKTPLPSAEFMSKIAASAKPVRMGSLEIYIENESGVQAHGIWNDLVNSTEGNLSCVNIKDDQKLDFSFTLPDSMLKGEALGTLSLGLTLQKLKEEKSYRSSLVLEPNFIDKIKLTAAEHIYLQRTDAKNYKDIGTISSKQMRLRDDLYEISFEIHRLKDGKETQREYYRLNYNVTN